MTQEDRVTEALAIKAERDRLAREREEEAERERVEAAQLRAEKIEAGLLEVCPECGREVDTQGEVVLKHDDYLQPASSSDRVCRGTGEQPLAIGDVPKTRYSLAR